MDTRILAHFSNKNKAAKSAQKPADSAQEIPIGSLFPCPENEQLYRPVDPNDPDVQSLAASIREHGVLDPLVVTTDLYVLSGHRRLGAAKLVGLQFVPCRVEPIIYAKCTSDEIVSHLREYNRQRVKSLDEVLREEVVSADPSVAYDALLSHRRKLSDMSESQQESIKLSARKRRSDISARKSEMVAAVLGAVENLRDFWPLSVRQLHYNLLSDPPRTNTSIRRSKYKNDLDSYKDLCNLTTRLRLTGEIPWEALSDETRPVTHWRCWPNAQDFIRQELDGLFKGYARDLQRTQPCHIEIVAEKLTLKNVLEPVAGQYGISLTIGRGYSSIMPRYEMAQRYRRTGKDRLIVLLLSDFDPDGETIAESFARSMRDDFGVGDITPIKVALTAAQATELNLPPKMTAKKSSGQYKKFAKKFGDTVFELEAVTPGVLQEFLREAVKSVLNIELYNAEIEAERQDAGFLETARQRACRALSEMAGDQN